MFPRPRILFFIALALAIPTYAISLVIFYFLFKRPYDSKVTSLILANAKNLLDSGRMKSELFHVNSAAIERVFWKFSVDELALKYGVGAVNVNWGVVIHPMINEGNPFTLRVTKEGGGRIKIEVADGEDWRYLKAGQAPSQGMQGELEGMDSDSVLRPVPGFYLTFSEDANEVLGAEEFLIETGVRVTHSRDMSAYDGKPFQCACGSTHEFHSFMGYRNFATTGANAKIMATCPRNQEIATLIKTKYKFLVVFDRFESLAGYTPK